MGVNRIGRIGGAASRHIPGFRTGTRWKMAVAGAYYAAALSALAISVWLSLFLLSAPFAGFLAAAAVRAAGASDFGSRTAGATAAALACAFCLAASALTLLPAGESETAVSAGQPGAPAVGESGEADRIRITLIGISPVDAEALQPACRPADGYVYLCVSVRLRNLSSFPRDTTLLTFYLEDAEGERYGLPDHCGVLQLGSFASGLEADETDTGNLVFAVPRDARGLRLVFIPSAGGGQLSFAIPADILASCVAAYPGNAESSEPAGEADAEPADANVPPAETAPSALPAASPGGLEIVSVTSPVAPGEKATVTIRGTPDTPYRIAVVYSSGPSRASGLEDKTSDENGSASWTWRVGASTKAGVYSIEVTGGGQTAAARITVTE